MPPRAKKATAALPSPDGPMLTPEPTETPVADEPAAVPAGAPPDGSHVEPAASPDLEPAAEPATPELPVAVWEPGEPCHLCFPAGPIPSATAVGCGHGTWKLVGATRG